MQTILLLVSLWPAVLASGEAMAQADERVYLDAVLEVTSKSKATYYREFVERRADLYFARTYRMDGQVKAEGTYRDARLMLEHGDFVFYHDNGKVESRGSYEKGVKSGVWQRFDKWGHQLAEKVYDPQLLAEILYTRAENMPVYPGGEKEMVLYLRSKVQGPGGDRVKGKATASFVVERDGSLTDVKVVEGMGDPYDQHLVDALEGSPPWEPGREKGRIVRVQMRVPVDF